MHRVLESEQLHWIYEAAERCKRCKEVECKQPVYVEVVYCPRFVPIEPPYHSARKTSVKS